MAEYPIPTFPVLDFNIDAADDYSLDLEEIAEAAARLHDEEAFA